MHTLFVQTSSIDSHILVKYFHSFHVKKWIGVPLLFKYLCILQQITLLFMYRLTKSHYTFNMIRNEWKVVYQLQWCKSVKILPLFNVHVFLLQKYFLNCVLYTVNCKSCTIHTAWRQYIEIWLGNMLMHLIYLYNSIIQKVVMLILLFI